MNDTDRENWVLNDEGLYLMQQRSGKSLRTFVRENRATIDAVIKKIESGEKRQHYLVYG